MVGDTALIPTLCAPVFPCDALHGTYDLLSDWRGHGRGVNCTVRTTPQVVHQLLQYKSVSHGHLVKNSHKINFAESHLFEYDMRDLRIDVVLEPHPICVHCSASCFQPERTFKTSVLYAAQCKVLTLN